MAIVTNGRLEYEMSAIDVTYPDIGKVTYRGSYPLIVPNQWAPPKTLGKGSVIRMAGKDYRVLKINDNIAEVLAQESNTVSSMGQGTEHPGDSAYFDTPMSTYLNSTYFNSLDKTIRDAILSQKLYIPAYVSIDYGYYENSMDRLSCNITGIDKIGCISKNADQYGPYSGTVSCYLLSLNDIVDYFDITLSKDESTIETLDGKLINELFNVKNPNTVLGFRTEAGNASYHAVTYSIFNCAEAIFHVGYDNTEFSVYPAFQIDLSKVEYTIK